MDARNVPQASPQIQKILNEEFGSYYEIVACVFEFFACLSRLSRTKAVRRPGQSVLQV